MQLIQIIKKKYYTLMLSFISLISSNKSLNIELENIPNIKKKKFKIQITWISDLRFCKEKRERKLG
jgi:site-specific DNA-cytosine methylase